MAGLLSRVKVSELTKGIHENIMINGVSIEDRKGQNGPINKMIYIKFAQVNAEGKRSSESELAWWKPDPTSDYFVTNLQEMSLQLHNILCAFMDEEAAFAAFDGVFESVGVTDVKEIESKKWKLSEVSKLNDAIKAAFKTAITPFIGNKSALMRVKLTTNYKGVGVEIPKYNTFVEPMTKEESELKFTDNELKTHAKAGNTEVKTGGAASTNTKATI